MNRSDPCPITASYQTQLNQTACDVRPQRLGTGNFASVYMIRSGLLAYKEVHRADEQSALLQEYETLKWLYLVCNDPTNSLFMLPKPYAFCDPKDPTSYIEVGPLVSPLLPTEGSLRSLRARSLTSPSGFAQFERATFAQERIFDLPFPLAVAIRTAFFPEDRQSIRVHSNMCRLYFGKIFSSRRSRFSSPSNFPLDVARYTRMYSEFGVDTADAIGLPSVLDVAWGMGLMLGRLHVVGGCDARGVEFVLGGDGGAGCSFYVLDFNQVRPWDKTSSTIPTLVDAFFANDPYFPLPRPTDPLYVEFRTAYLAQYSEDTVELGRLFLQRIETEQARKDLLPAPGAMRCMAEGLLWPG